MEFITYPILFIACLVWFFSKWKENREEAEYLRKKDEAEEAAYQREKAYLDELRARAEKGDKNAVGLLRCFGCDVRNYN